MSDLSLQRAHTSEGTYSHVLAHLMITPFILLEYSVFTVNWLLSYVSLSLKPADLFEGLGFAIVSSYSFVTGEFTFYYSDNKK